MHFAVCGLRHNGVPHSLSLVLLARFSCITKTSRSSSPQATQLAIALVTQSKESCSQPACSDAVHTLRTETNACAIPTPRHNIHKLRSNPSVLLKANSKSCYATQTQIEPPLTSNTEMTLGAGLFVFQDGLAASQELFPL